jgi:hypothetical protein
LVDNYPQFVYPVSIEFTLGDEVTGAYAHMGYDHLPSVGFLTDDLTKFFEFIGSMLGKYSNILRKFLGDSFTHSIDGLIALLV